MAALASASGESMQDASTMTFEGDASQVPLQLSALDQRYIGGWGGSDRVATAGSMALHLAQTRRECEERAAVLLDTQVRTAVPAARCQDYR
jgi:hypothetical protein